MDRHIINESIDKWEVFDDIFMGALGLLNIAQDINDCTLYKDGEPMGYYSFDRYDFTTPIECEKDTIISIYVFGDGTLELLCQGAEEPICWDSFSVKTLSIVKQSIYEELKKLKLIHF